jgi:hypothetical protein
MYTSQTDFDLRTIPFSMRGAWFNLSTVVGWHQRSDIVHLVSHRNGINGVLTFTPERGDVAIDTQWIGQPSQFTWQAADGGSVTAVFDGPEVLRLRGDGLGVRVNDAAGELTPFTGSYLFRDPVTRAAVFTCYETGRRYRITPLEGSFEVVGAEALGVAQRAVVLGGDGQPWEIALQETTTAAAPFTSQRSFDEAVAAAGQAFTDYVEAIAPWRDERTPAVELAAYVMWSATVAPEGFVTRETILMSKHWMDKLWSWDHCFNADAVAEGLPDQAIDQFLAPFDHLDAAGALPDSISHSEMLLNYVKPPIHGWAFSRLRPILGRDLTHDELDEIYQGLARWTEFWLTARRAPGHRLPHYQHGNDSGWDNATTFDADRLIEAPDLAAFLVLQLETVAALGDELGYPVERWKATRDDILSALVEQLWTADGFVAVGVLNGRVSSTSSLLRLLPIILGERLEPEIRQRLATDLIAHFTPYGPATELPTSPHYEDDGYWRGPIWAPSTALIEDGLRRSGHTDLADTVSERFRGLCEHHGFAENFDALTGAGLRDRAYTWTASVYLSLCRDYVRRCAR